MDYSFRSDDGEWHFPFVELVPDGSELAVRSGAVLACMAHEQYVNMLDTRIDDLLVAAQAERSR